MTLGRKPGGIDEILGRSMAEIDGDSSKRRTAIAKSWNLMFCFPFEFTERERNRNEEKEEEEEGWAD